MDGKTTRYHWVLVLNGHLPNGAPAGIGDDGILEVPAGGSRIGEYRRLRASLLEQFYEATGMEMQNPVTTCWSLEPDQL
jgi:hypothetical protein